MAASHTPSFDSQKFWKEQDFQQSARLHLQHWIWDYQLNYTLHPKITIPIDAPIRVADIACGNGAWILDLARQRPNATFDGFDITPAHFPAAGFLPENITFRVWDAFTNIPNEYTNVYDVIHIRALYSAIKDNKTEPIIENILKMLKPGGYIQWDEQDASTMKCDVPFGVEAPASTTLSKFSTIMLSIPSNNLSADWLHDLPRTLSKSGCEVVAEEHMPPNPVLQRAWSDNFLTVWQHTLPLFPVKPWPLPKIPGLPEEMSRQAGLELWLKAVEECSKGAWINQQQVVVVARKAG